MDSFQTCAKNSNEDLSQEYYMFNPKYKHDAVYVKADDKAYPKSYLRKHSDTL